MPERLAATLNSLQNALDASALRSQVIGNNIANADTPGFKSSYVRFEELLSEQLGDTLVGKRTRERHMPIPADSPQDVRPVVVRNEDTTMDMDGNNVDIESEMTELARNTLYYNTLIQKLNGQFDRLRMAIREGK